MAHLIIEYSTGVARDRAIDQLCRAAYEAMRQSDVFALAGIRVRAHQADHAIIADDDPQNDFAALTLVVGSGRSTKALQTAGEMVFAAAQAALKDSLAGEHFALSLEIRQIDPALSWKDTPIHNRLQKG